MMELNPGSASRRPVSDYEESAWLLQQQYPERVLKHFSAWRMARDTDLAGLEKALLAVVASLPALNARYRFDDDGELHSLQGADPQACLQVLQVASAEEASARLLALQAQPWDAEGEAPAQALIIGTDEAPILAFMLHQILDCTCREDDLYRLTLDACAGRPLGVPHLPWLQGQALAAAPAAAVAPASASDEVAALILGEFRTALAVPGMTAQDDFFDLGGHSLLATRIIGKLSSNHGIEVRFNDFFSAPSAAALAARAQVSGREGQAVAGVQDEVQRAPFALAQASLGRAYAAFDFGTIFNLPFAMSFLDPVDEAVFEQAFSDLVKRHASLRTTFHFEGDEAWQQLVPLERLGQYKWFWSSRESEGASLASEARHRFDLSRELPMRVRFLRDPQRKGQTLSLLVNHMAIDEWSLNVMMEDLARAYLARASDRAPSWEAPVPSFHRYALEELARGINRQHLAYWTDMLRDATRGLRLPAIGGDSPVPAGEASTRAQWFEILPDQAMIDHLYRFARQNDASLFGVIYTAIALALHKVGDLRDLVIGTSASGRTDPAYYETVGYFTTMVAHRVQFDPQQRVGALIEGVSRLVNDSMAYADVPLEQIQQALGMTAADGLLFDVYVQIHANNALNGALSRPEGEKIRYRQIDPEKNESMFGIQFEIMENLIEGQRSLRLVVTYRTERYSAAQMARVTEAIEGVFGLFAREGGAGLLVQEVRV
ncbi:condensation domain-containing protein [Pseudomonas sp. 148P]|uniref:Condensation domain-containing protein n=1 Tax=Pseudomonas ulcerans TaxID=3115852 RepID=A0ABU7HPY8_9PSED|nr:MULTISPECIES: condensation domain-containing protein [unclassified Pseudomonas]MEE1922617.1 condensation domain-containing protein [Pseudomonas sp. 147P]MEE1933594.1 condensation domain-containing protein [Pseudomonas sp. 148P]